jgi:hypothetical protein
MSRVFSFNLEISDEKYKQIERYAQLSGMGVVAYVSKTVYDRVTNSISWETIWGNIVSSWLEKYFGYEDVSIYLHFKILNLTD